MFTLFAKFSSRFFESFIKYRKIIIPISLFLTIVCFCVFLAFIILDFSISYIPLLAMFVVSSPNNFYSFIDLLEDITKDNDCI